MPQNQQPSAAIRTSAVLLWRVNYDTNGNLSYKASTSQTDVYSYDVENRLATVTRNGAVLDSYGYDADGQRVRKISNGSTTYYPNQYYEQYDGNIDKYYYFNGQPVALRRNGWLAAMHEDQIGNLMLVTSAGARVDDQGFYAYGKLRRGIIGVERSFTGQQKDFSTGLIYMHARYYDPVLGQFLSPDTLVPDATNVMDFNRYAYARGNPMKYNDPTGHDPDHPNDDDPRGPEALEQFHEWLKYRDQAYDAEMALQKEREAQALLATQTNVAPPAESTPLENAVQTNAGVVAPDAPPAADIGSSQTSDTVTLENSIAGNNADAAYLRELPQRYGNQGPTSGTLVVNGQKIPVESGENGPAANMPKGAPGFNAYVRTHAEGNAAAEMHKLGAQSGTLYINNNAGPCEACRNNLDYAVPKGSTLRVVWGDLFGIHERTFGATAK